MAKKVVKNNKKANTGVSNDISPTNGRNLSFDFSYHNWMRGVEVGNFTSKLRDEASFSKCVVEIFTQLLPIIHENWKEIYKNGASNGQFKHCHTVASNKITLVHKIASEIHGNKFETESDDSFNIWQLGTTQSIRLFCIYDHVYNIMYPVFIDYHHLIHLSKNHNQADTSKYSYCPISTYS
ncbi:hypothetical protein [Paenibacillus sp. QZ-Y1]|uniref:hypothetical protein n=1 Tax=Paenibacillus sp. QZ-Y1 TaxID=3414511 RepID=UPI003F79E7F0